MPPWTSDEFEVLRGSHSMSDADLARRLPSRSVGALGWVRSGLHSFHQGGDVSMLSEMMKETFHKNPGGTTCPRCVQVF